MQQSSELQGLYLQSCEAMSSGDHAFFERHFSQNDGVLAIGTDPAEWWSGYATISKVFREQMQEAGGFQIVADSPEAYCEGPVGWVAGRPTLMLPDGAEVPLRLTAVFLKEKDAWKIVQWHFSSGISNTDLLGKTLST